MTVPYGERTPHDGHHRDRSPQAIHTAVVLDEHDQILDQLRIDADATQLWRLLRFARRCPERTWAVENANGLGRLLARQLVDAEQVVVDVPARLSARVRTLSGAGHKTDAHDAVSTAIAGRHAKVLRPVVADGIPELLGLLIDRRWQIASAARRLGCAFMNSSASWCLVAFHGNCRPTGPPACCSPSVPPSRSRHGFGRWSRNCWPSCGSWIASARSSMPSSIRPSADYGTCLTEIDGIGRVAAATIIAIVGDVHRFPTAAPFASFSGTAPIAASSDDVGRYRLNCGSTGR